MKREVFAIATEAGIKDGRYFYRGALERLVVVDWSPPVRLTALA